jgi:predicted membrane-bound mannosyltransferase
MPDHTPRDIDEWHLGIEAGDPRPPRPPVASREPEPPDLSDDRLDVPVYVMTIEHLGWAVIALYALLTRLAALGLRPLNSIEASQALFAREMTGHGLSLLATEPRASGWIDPLRAGVMLVFGSSDYGVRIVAAIFGLMLIGAAFAMRRQLGRAGALAFAAMITLSPTLTYFSRSTSAAIPAIALVVVAVALMFALAGTSDTLKVVGVAIASALALTAEAIVIPIAAMFLAVLIVMGLFELFFRPHPMIRMRVWWERRSAQLVFCVAIAVGVFVVFESALGRRNLLLPMLFGAMQEWLPVMHPELRGGLDFYLPALVF